MGWDVFELFLLTVKCDWFAFSCGMASVDAWELAEPWAGLTPGSTCHSLGLWINFHCSHLLEEPMTMPGEGGETHSNLIKSYELI